jgi:hypothetical protein
MNYLKYSGNSSVIVKNLRKVNNRPNGKKTPNLVTLISVVLRETKSMRGLRMMPWTKERPIHAERDLAMTGGEFYQPTVRPSISTKLL